MIKKTLIAVIALLAAASLAACGESNTQEETTAAETVVATETATTAAEAETKTEAAGEETEAADGEEKEAADTEEETTEETTQAAEEDENGLVKPSEKLEESWTGVVAAEGDGLSLRLGPGSDYEAILIVPDDTELEIEAEDGSWGYTSYAGESGWVSTDWLV